MVWRTTIAWAILRRRIDHFLACVFTLLGIVALTVSAVPASAQPIGDIDLPYLYGDAGMVAMQAGSDVTVTWEDPPLNGLAYAFIWKSFRAEKSWRIMGVDFDPSDGVSIAWNVPEFIGGMPFGVALLPPGRLAFSTITALTYGSGKAPPEGICSASYASLSGSPEVFEGPGTGAILGYLSDYAPVLERIVDDQGFPWLRVDLTPGRKRAPARQRLDLCGERAFIGRLQRAGGNDGQQRSPAVLVVRRNDALKLHDERGNVVVRCIPHYG